MKRYLTLLSLSALLWAGAGMAAGYPEPHARMLMARSYSLDEAVSGVRRRNPGRVLSADTVRQDGRPVHRVRIIDENGRVRGYRIDGETGKPLRQPRRR